MIDMIANRFATGILLMLLAGCASAPPPVGSSAIGNVSVLSELPTPQAVDVKATTRTAFIGPFTELRIEVFGVPELQRDVLTDGEGRFAFPLAGSVDAAGKTPDQVSADLTNRLTGRYVREPKVTVNFKSASSALALLSQSVTVDGQILRPGAYPVVGRVTLMRAIAQAGGLTEFAKLDDVVVFRNVGEQRYAGIYNLGAIRRGNYPDPEIFPNDVVIVGDSPQRRLFKDLLAASPLFTTPLIILGSKI